MPPKAIPDRWIPYKACGEVIEGTRIICFKVPLKLVWADKKHLAKKKSATQRRSVNATGGGPGSEPLAPWETKVLSIMGEGFGAPATTARVPVIVPIMSVQKNVREIKKKWDIPTVLADIPRLGAVIDLTNTARYYNPLDFKKANILHRKILMPGRVVPPERSVQEFMNTLDDFLAKKSESLVGVHCTHGLNRTGYMVCRYMRDRMGIPAEEAITKFETARGYKMERDIYKNSILGKPEGTSGEAKEPEVIPVKRRRDDVNYRSPLGDYGDWPSVDSRNRYGNRSSPRRNHVGNRDGPNADSRNRFGNRPNSDRPNSDRPSSDRYSNQRNANSDRSTSSNAFFTCYTDRYKSDRDFSTRSKGDTRRKNTPPISRRNHGEGRTDKRRTSNDTFNRNEDRPKSNDRPREYDNPRSNDNTRVEDSSRRKRPRLDNETKSGL